MKTCAYDEFYLPMAMENLGDALEYAVCELALEPDDFFQRFLASGVADAFGNGNPVFMAGLSGAECTGENRNNRRAAFHKRKRL